jgi:hypothetical protein
VRVPVISRFFGIVIRMYFFDHEPPHFHAAYGAAEARIRIDPVGLLAGSLPPRPLALVVEWASLHKEDLLDNWRRLHADEPPQQIEPLE